ncbi:MAG: tRNA-dihydrouridine synthase family protein, partial [Coriobacteriales bacterium]|nr:tRNA-dihydrouridine synthase family protein [Coriobacteriales bacterium]
MLNGIKNLNDDFELVLAPMASVTDLAFRSLCVYCGAKTTYTEMVSAKGLFYKNERTWDYIYPSKYENGINVQIFGSDPNLMANVAIQIQEKLQNSLLSIDVNMGCPVKKVVKNGEGSALFNNPKLASKIIYALKQSLNCPVSAKTRI